MMKRIIISALMIFSFSVYAQPGEEDGAIHDELRQVIGTVENAINSGDYDKMLPVMSENLRATPITQEFISGKAAIKPYFESWFGPDKFLKKLNISFNADVVTELSPDKTWGVAYGKGMEKYQLSDGRTYDFPTRWTATVALEDGAWKIRTIHIGTDFTDNPLLNETRNALQGMMYGAGGLVIGLLAGIVLFRSKSAVKPATEAGKK